MPVGWWSGWSPEVKPMAARVDPLAVSARHQSLHHFVAKAPWEAADLLRAASDYALGLMERHGPVSAWIVDDSGIPKKGRHSVGVARQYCAPLGKQDNCQVAVVVSLANTETSVPCAYQLYLPQEWADDPVRRRKAGVPTAIEFQKKWQIALDQIDQLAAEGLPLAPVVADAGYGVATEFRDALTERSIPYGVGVTAETTVWPPGTGPLPPTPWSGRGRPPSLLRRSPENAPLSVLKLAQQLPKQHFRTITWREGTRGRMKARCAAIRVRPAHRDLWRREPRAEEWLLIEWPKGEDKPTKYWLSTVSEEATLEDLVSLVKTRWRIERDFQELKDELGLDHYEGRGWEGFHHHGALCIAAYAFLVAERARLSPPAPLRFLKTPPVPQDYRPRGSSRAS
jgi:SRSO17 transposase